MSKQNINSKLRKLVKNLIIILNISFLGIFKYFNWFIDSIFSILNFFNFNISFTVLTIILPIGISFYTFQIISYVIDVYRNELEISRDLVTFSLYISFFPKILSGPIERGRNFIPQIEMKKSINLSDIKKGLFYLIKGYFFKSVIADRIALIIQPFYDNPFAFSSLESYMIIWLFTIQIYADFSGYTNIAIGVAKFFGYDLTINFDKPYFSTNIQSFWRKWHVSLSQWFRDYIYIPLGGNQTKKAKIYRNIIITMVIAGLWHGAGYNYLIWGLLHGVYLIIFREYQEKKKRKNSNSNPSKFIIFLKWFLTIQSVCFAWVFFRAPNLIVSSQVFQQLILSTIPNSIRTYHFFILILFSYFTIFFLDWYKDKINNSINKSIHQYKWIINGIIYGFMVIMLLLAGSSSYSFIYEGY